MEGQILLVGHLPMRRVEYDHGKVPISVDKYSIHMGVTGYSWIRITHGYHAT